MRRKPPGLLAQAIAFAAAAHDGQTRKGSKVPYIVHPMEAASIAATLTDDPEVLAAAVLHDVVEDCGVAPEELRRRFGERVSALVAAETEEKEADARASWQRRKQRTIDRLQGAPRETLILTLADKLSNLRAMRRDLSSLGRALWQRFNQSDPAMHGWYYASIAQALRPLENTAAYREFTDLLGQVFDTNEELEREL